MLRDETNTLDLGPRSELIRDAQLCVITVLQECMCELARADL